MRPAFSVADDWEVGNCTWAMFVLISDYAVLTNTKIATSQYPRIRKIDEINGINILIIIQ